MPGYAISGEAMRLPKYLRILVLFVLLLVSAGLWAQTAAAPAGPYDAVVKRLDAMTKIPLGEWRFHDDSLPHPELAGEDSANWPLVKVGEDTPAGTGWYCRWIELPPAIGGYDVTGLRARFDYDLNADGWRSRVYYDGSMVAGHDTDTNPITLTENARPGQKVFVAIYINSSGKRVRLTRAALQLESRQDITGPDVLRDEIAVAASLLEAGGADAAAHKQQLGDAVKLLDFAALDKGDSKSFQQSLEKAQDALQPVGQWVRQNYTIRAVGNAHMDMAWLWPWTETVEVVRNTYSTVLQLMRQYPDFRYAQSQAQSYEWMEDKYPALFEEIRQRVKEGRWEIVGGMWIEPDLNMPDGESLVRQLLMGKRYFRDKFGVDTRVGWNPDSFGYNWQLPQIYKRAGIDYFVTQKMAWNDTTAFPYKLFWWQSPDGSRLLTYFPRDYVNDLEPKGMAKVQTQWSRETGTNEMLWLYGVGDHGGGPTREMLDMAHRSQQPKFVFPTMEFSSAQDFFSGLEKQLPTMKVPTWNGELYFEKHRGVQTTQSETKRRNRLSEVRMLSAEKFSALASLYGMAYPQQELNSAWKKVLFNQFHDILPGSGIAPVYRDAARDHEVVGLMTAEVTGGALDVLSAQADTRGVGVPVIIFNALAWPRTDTVEFEVALPGVPAKVEVRAPGGKAVPADVVAKLPATQRVKVRATVSVPGMGYTVLHISAAGKIAPRKSTLLARGLTLENEFLRVQVDQKSGCITSLFDKKQGKEAVAEGGCGNLLQAFVDKPKHWDAWDIDATFEDKKWDLDQADEVKLVESSATRAVIRVRKHFQNSTFVQDITLYPGVPRVDIVTQADWHEKHILLKAAFPLSAHNDLATYEIPYGSVQRPTTRRTPQERAQFEVPAQRWADLSDASGSSGFSLLNAGKYGYDCKDSVLRISLLRSPEWPDPHADEGMHQFTYSLYPHAGDWKQAGTVRRGYELNYPLVARQITAHAGQLPAAYSFVSLEPANLVLSAIKKAEDDDSLIFRMYEFEGRKVEARLQVPRAAAKAVEVNLMEAEQQPLTVNAAGKEVVIPVQPYEIKSVKVSFTK